jgi:hypothetical protein
MKKDLQNKLKAYSSLATTAALLAPLAVSGEIVYTDIDPDVTLAVGETYEVDFNGDAVIDVTIGLTSGTSSSGNIYQNIAFADGGGNGSVAGSTASFGAIFYFPQTYGAGASIGGSADWQPANAFGSLNYLTSVGGVPAYFGGNFSNQSDKYLAIRFDNGGVKHYGWVRLDVGEAGDMNFVTVKDFAFESVANEAIEAGATTGGATGIEDLALENAFSVYGFGNSVSVQSTSSEFTDVTVEIFNISGQMVANGNLNGNSATYAINDAEGLYVVRLRAGKAVMNRKVYLGGN